MYIVQSFIQVDSICDWIVIDIIGYLYAYPISIMSALTCVDKWSLGLKMVSV